MKKSILIILICTLVFSCTKKSEETYSYTFQENAQLTIEPYYEGSYMKNGTVTQGNNLVFTYRYEAEDEINVADDEYSEVIQFEIEPTSNEFDYSDNELVGIKAVYTESCFCDFTDETKNTSPQGNIRGKKISETEWDISIDVTFYTDDQKNISTIFRLEK